MFDHVFIHDLKLRTVIGVYDWERTAPREIIINIILFTDIQKAEVSDDIADCVNYADMAEKISQVASEVNRFTVEALAGDIARVCLGERLVRGVRVRIDKPGAIDQAHSVGVEIERYKI